jgi:2-haloacid dehalogenase
MEAAEIGALTFDVFGTVVDWRGSIIRQGEEFGREHGLQVDWGALALAWRGLYQPRLSEVRDGKRPWTKLDTLHRESLDELLPRFGLERLGEAARDHLNRFWHRLDPWPDAVEGLTRLKRNFIVVPLSNGNVSLLLDMAKRAGLPWDAILGAEVVRHYKPQPAAYLDTAALLDLPPERCMMVATHYSDLVAARGNGFRTAYVYRPFESGPVDKGDLPADHGLDLVVQDFNELARKLGCA